MSESMPDDIKRVFDGISNELIWLYAKWNVFSQLYATSEERIKLLGDTLPSFFSMLQRVYRDDIYLSISRLTDPARTGHRENMSLARLLEMLASGNAMITDEVSSLTSEVQALAEPFRNQRNRRLAHLDLPTSLRDAPEPLPSIGRQEIENILALMARLLNRILLHYEDTETYYAGVVLQGDGDGLIFYMKQAVEYSKQKRDARWNRTS